ncbi:sensor histidine kinase [Facklamia languida]
MKLSIFLKDKWIFLLSQTAIILFLALLLNTMKISNAAIALVCICFCFITVVSLILEYLQKNCFYRQLYQNLDAMEKKHYISSVIEEAGFTEGALLIDVLKQTTKSMNDEIASYRRMNTEYQDYIETWIHEIKIPISCIDLICENNKGEMASGVKEELSRIDGYVEQALYYARSTNLEKDYMIREINLDNLVKGTLKKYSKQLIAAKATPTFDNLSQTVYGDAKWLEFVLGQLIANSIKYKKDTLMLTFSACEEQDHVLLYVSDDGIGIQESELPRIFEKGFTGTNGRSYAKTTGIGLYLCRKLCNKMHLSISASSANGQGTTIQITFPTDSRLLLE